MRSITLASVLWLHSVVAFGQSAMIRLETRSHGLPVADVDIVVRGETYQTDAQGVAVVTVPSGATEIAIVKEGFHPQTVSLQLQVGQSQHGSLISYRKRRSKKRSR